MKRICQDIWLTDDGQRLLELNVKTATVHANVFNAKHLIELAEAAAEAANELAARLEAVEAN